MDDRKTKCVQALLTSSSKPSKRCRAKKRETFRMQEPPVLERVRQFLPEIEAANRELPDSTTEDAVVDFETVGERSHSDDEERDGGEDQRENGRKPEAPSSTVEMNLALYEYTSSESESDSDSENGHCDESKGDWHLDGTSGSSDDDNNVVTSKTLRLRKENAGKRPRIEEMSNDRADEPDTTT